MSREPIFPRRHTLYVHISLEVAEALRARARAEQAPQRAVVEAALRAYLGAARQDAPPACSTTP